MSKTKKPIVSDPVQYVASTGAVCAALVIGVVDGSMVNLSVFMDAPAYGAGPLCLTAVPYSEEPQPHTWHWPERA